MGCPRHWTQFFPLGTVPSDHETEIEKKTNTNKVPSAHQLRHDNLNGRNYITVVVVLKEWQKAHSSSYRLMGVGKIFKSVTP
jgi:hypothetical protein